MEPGGPYHDQCRLHSNSICYQYLRDRGGPPDPSSGRVQDVSASRVSPSPVDAGGAQVAVDGAVEALLRAPLLAGGQLAVQRRHVEQHRGLLEGDRALAARQARQRVVPATAARAASAGARTEAASGGARTEAEAGALVRA